MEACILEDEKDEALKYIVKLPDPQDRAEVRFGCFLPIEMGMLGFACQISAQTCWTANLLCEDTLKGY